MVLLVVSMGARQPLGWTGAAGTAVVALPSFRVAAVLRVATRLGFSLAWTGLNSVSANEAVLSVDEPSSSPSVWTDKAAKMASAIIKMANRPPNGLFIYECLWLS